MTDDKHVVHLVAALAAELRPHAEGDPSLAWMLEDADDFVEAYWAGYEPTDDEIMRTSRPVHDLDGYDLGDPKRVALQRENGL